jgi:SulP family sulfate permease
VVDLRRVSGVDASAVVTIVKVVHLAQANGFELVFTGTSDGTREQLRRGGVEPLEGVVAFESDLDRGLQRCEDLLLAGAELGRSAGDDPARVLVGMPERLRPHLRRETIAEGAVLIRQGEPSEDLFVLESGMLQIETQTPQGTRMRLRTIRPGVVVGEVAMYTEVPRTADVVAEEPSVVLRLSKESIARIQAEEPELAAALHEWLATTLADRLSYTQRAVDALMDLA